MNLYWFAAKIDKLIEAFCWHTWVPYYFGNESVVERPKQHWCLHCGKWKYQEK